MTHEEFEEIINQLHQLEKKILVDRAKRYSSNTDDRLINFKESANFCRITPIKDCLVKMSKHLFALRDYIENYKGENPNIELIKEYIIDIRNYLALMFALFMEDSKKS